MFAQGFQLGSPFLDSLCGSNQLEIPGAPPVCHPLSHRTRATAQARLWLVLTRVWRRGQAVTAVGVGIVSRWWIVVQVTNVKVTLLLHWRYWWLADIVTSSTQ